MHAEELWSAQSVGARLLRTLLTPLSWLYALGWQSYLAVYRYGLKNAKEPHRPVVCVGNLIAGGSGKTPLTIHVADVLRELGSEVAVSCSGYGSPAAQAARLAPAGPLKASEWGDEAALIRWLQPGVPLIVGRRRVLAAEICRREMPRAVLLMDDGFQHLPLKKHLAILLDPAQDNHRCLPAGPYREPARNRSRGDLVLGAGARDDRDHGPNGFEVVVGDVGFTTPSGDARELRGDVSVLCALGRPRGFLEALRSHGLHLEAVTIRPDHDPLTEGNLLSGLPASLPIVVTGKDWVKLRERPDVERYDVAIASHAVTVEPRDDFRNWLQKKLNGLGNEEAP